MSLWEAELATEVEPIPGWLGTRLAFRVGLSEEDVARMTVEEAQAAWIEHQTRLKAATHEHTLPGDAPINAPSWSGAFCTVICCNGAMAAGDARFPTGLSTG